MKWFAFVVFFFFFLTFNFWMMEFFVMGNVNFVRNVKCVHIYFLKF